MSRVACCSDIAHHVILILSCRVILSVAKNLCHQLSTASHELSAMNYPSAEGSAMSYQLPSNPSTQALTPWWFSLWASWERSGRTYRWPSPLQEATVRWGATTPWRYSTTRTPPTPLSSPPGRSGSFPSRAFARVCANLTIPPSPRTQAVVLFSPCGRYPNSQ